MNRKIFRNCIIIGILGLLIVGVAGGIWYLFSEPSGGALPIVQFIQPKASHAIYSGQGLVLIVEGQSEAGLDRIELFVDGQLERSASAFGELTFQAVVPWFGSALGNHEISAIGYDRGGHASQPASILVTVQGADIPTVIQDAQPLDVNQTIEEIVAGAGAGAGHPVGAAQPDEAAQPLPAGDEPPVAELLVTPMQDGDSVIAHVQVRASDNTGVTQMRLIIQSPGGNPELTEYDCEGNLECSREFDRPLAESGKWVFILTAVDLSGQIAQQQFASVDVICNAGVDANNQPFMNCAADGENIPVPGGPILGEPPQLDDEAPTAELKVTPIRNGDLVAAIVEMSGHDNVGLGLLRLETQTPVGVFDNFAVGCEANPDCSFEFVHPLAEPGVWIFILQSVDLAGQVSLPHWADVQVICNMGVDENNQPLMQCAVADEAPPAPGNDPGNQPGWEIPAERGFWNPDEDPVIEPLDVATPLLCRGAPPQQESFEIDGCQIILPVNVPGGPFTSCSFSTLLRADLRGVDLRNANLYDTNMIEANLTCGADLRNADLRLVNFYNTRIDNSTKMDIKSKLVWELVNQGGYSRDFPGADLSESRLFQADLVWAGFRDANLSGSWFDLTNFFGADLNSADLTDTTWRNVTCPDGTKSQDHGDTCINNLQPGLPRLENFMIGDCLIIQPVPLAGPYTECVGADLSNQDLRQVNLTNANLFRASLSYSDLRDTNFEGADLRLVDMLGSRIDQGTTVDDKWLLVWSLVNRGGRSRDLSGADLSWANLDSANLAEAILTNADLSSASMNSVDFSGATLNGANLTLADFRNTNLENVQLEGVIWSGTWCPDGSNSHDVGGTCEGHLSP